MDISVVIPLLNEEESLPELEAWIRRVMNEHGYSYELVMIDDGSTDSSWSIIEQLSAQNPSVVGIKFRRNYGKSAGLNEGFLACKGNVVITMDADLQDSPEEIPELYKLIAVDGYDIISGWKKKRYDSFIKNNTSKIYNWAARFMSGIQLHDFNCGLKSYKRDVVKNIEVYGEMHRYIPIIAKTAGFKKIGEKVVKHQARKYGETKFGIARFIRGPLDLMSISFVGKFSKRPMHFFGIWGIIIFIIGFFASLFIGVSKLYYLGKGMPAPLVTDSPYFYIALVCMIMGTQLFLTGFLAELVARNAPNRNNYSVEKRLGMEDTTA
ncbi:MAG: glycosyltransferase family 2 protein [Aureispira sp.]|nr:glycosyltransferase family 2 protein [Aureispira sp.]